MAGNINQPAFRWPVGSTVNINAGTTTGNVQFQSADLSRHARVYNAGSVTAFVEFGTSGVTASTTTSFPMAPGVVEVVAAPYPYMAAITASGTAIVYVTPGEGL